MASAVTPSPSVNRTACKRSLQARSGLRPPPAGYVERWTTAFLKVQRQQRADTGRTPWQRERPQRPKCRLGGVNGACEQALSRPVAATRPWKRPFGPRDPVPRVGAGPRCAANRRAREFLNVGGGQSIRQRPTGQGPDYVARFRGQTCLIARQHTLAHWRPT